MRRAAASILALLLAGISLLASGCLSPMEATNALEAPLPPDGTPFVVMATSCFFAPDAATTVLILYPNATLYRLRVSALPDTPNADGIAPHAPAERAALDAESTGALRITRDDQGRFEIVSSDTKTLTPGELTDIRLRVTVAGFGGLHPAYSDPNIDDACGTDYAAWIDGRFIHVSENADAGPWSLHKLRDALRGVN